MDIASYWQYHTSALVFLPALHVCVHYESISLPYIIPATDHQILKCNRCRILIIEILVPLNLLHWKQSFLNLCCCFNFCLKLNNQFQVVELQNAYKHKYFKVRAMGAKGNGSKSVCLCCKAREINFFNHLKKHRWLKNSFIHSFIILVNPCPPASVQTS